MALTIIIGGLGLFMLGMNMLTEGLKALADDKLKSWLEKFAGGTFSSILSGAIMTMLIQSSNATIIITIGFVSAGLLTFLQSVGVIIGANIGTTSIGWIVSLLGFKLDLTQIALPVVGFGVFASLFLKNRLKHLGNAFAGFGLLFLGIATLQSGMLAAQDFLALDFLAGGKWWQYALLILIGFVMTVIMQSSGASVATTLTLLATNAIVFDQAAFLVIGHNLGTTVTAFLASFGATSTAKRTALTHVIFNYVTAVIVIILLPFILPLSLYIGNLIDGTANNVVGIAVFHTLFSVIGAIVFIPLLSLFVKIMLRLIPDRGNPFTKYLDKNVAQVPALAHNAAFNTLLDMIDDYAVITIELLYHGRISNESYKKVLLLDEAVAITRKFLTDYLSSTVASQNKQIALLHALDHIERLSKAILEGSKIEVHSIETSTVSDFINILTLINDYYGEDETTATANEENNRPGGVRESMSRLHDKIHALTDIDIDHKSKEDTHEDKQSLLTTNKEKIIADTSEEQVAISKAKTEITERQQHLAELQSVADRLEEISLRFADRRRAGRDHYFLQSVRNETGVDTAMTKITALLWIDRLAFHYWRTIARLAEYANDDSK